MSSLCEFNIEFLRLDENGCKIFLFSTKEVEKLIKLNENLG